MTYFKNKKNINETYIPDRLMIVAHPDDETLFGGYHLGKDKNKWKVLVLSNGKSKIRIKEMKNAMDVNNISFEAWSVPEKELSIRKHAGKFPQLEEQLVEEIVDEDGNLKYKYIVTHNPHGEYGHAQHRGTHAIVSKVAKKLGIPIYVFDHGNRKIDPKTKKKMFSKYVKRQGVINLPDSGAGSVRDYFYKEKFTPLEKWKGCKCPKTDHYKMNGKGGCKC